MQNKKFIIAAVVVIAVIGGALYYLSGGGLLPSKKVSVAPENKPRVITEENFVIPKTEKISEAEGKMMNLSAANAVEVPLAPKNEGEKVIVPKAMLTVKGSYDLARPQAAKWASDAQLVFIKSLGAITLEGKSSQWQLAFHSKNKSKGYEIIVWGNQIASQKEIESTAIGMDTPQKWFDSDQAIKTLQDMPQYSNASASAINFFYNTDAKEWKYGVATSAGVTSIRLRQ